MEEMMSCKKGIIIMYHHEVLTKNYLYCGPRYHNHHYHDHQFHKLYLGRNHDSFSHCYLFDASEDDFWDLELLHIASAVDSTIQCKQVQDTSIDASARHAIECCRFCGIILRNSSDNISVALKVSGEPGDMFSVIIFRIVMKNVKLSKLPRLKHGNLFIVLKEICRRRSCCKCILCL